MQVRLIHNVSAFALAVGLLTGCGGGGSSAGGGAGAGESKPTNAAQPAAAQVVQTVVTQAQHVVQAVEDVAHQAQAKAVEATAEVQKLMTQAKSLLAEKKVQDAGGVVSKLAGMSLSTDQKQSVSGLQTELKQLAADIEKGLTDLKTLVTEKKYSEATALVSKLANYQLSPEQQKLFDSLKLQATKLLGGQAAEQGTKAVTDLLPRR